MNKKEVRVAVTGAAGQIGYALLFRIASGEMFGKDTDVHLNLLELEGALPALNGICMELCDCAFPLLKSITQTKNVNVAFNDVDWALLVGSVPRKAGMERGDLLKINGGIFINQGESIDQYAKENCKVLVVGNPCNTNAYIAKEKARRIPKENFFAMTMLDQNRGVAQIAKKAGVFTDFVDGLIIWGNHSATQFPNFYEATIKGVSVEKVIDDEKWFKEEFLSIVQNRGAEIIQARGLSSAASAANAIVDSVRNLTNQTRTGKFFSMGVCSDGSYGIDEGLMFSFPIRTDGDTWKIIQGVEFNSFSQEKINVTHKELCSERDDIKELLKML